MGAPLSLYAVQSPGNAHCLRIGRIYAKRRYVEVERWGVLVSGRAIRMNGEYKAPVTSAAMSAHSNDGEMVVGAL